MNMPQHPSPLLQRWAAPLTVVPLALLFHYLFLGMASGLNVAIYAWAAMAVAMGRYGWRQVSTPARLAFAGSAFSALMFVVHHSTLAGVATFGGLMLFAGLVHEPRLRGVFHPMLQAVAAFFVAPFRLRASTLPTGPAVRTSPWQLVRSGFIPLLVTSVFIFLYQGGNPRFGQVTASLWDGLMDLLGELFSPRILFFMLGLMVSATLVRRLAPGRLVQIESSMSDLLVRKRVPRPRWAPPAGLNPLDRERKAGIILLAMLNTVLLVVNLIDIHWLWFGFTVPEDFSLKQFVHEGTWLLVISILLGMCVLLVLFRDNLNFHPRNQGLKMLALTWVAQNFVLGISVFLRNWHYISFHGLAYKRIGVMVFLLLVLVGLATMFRKVRDRRSLFYLARVNGWAWFVVMVALTAVDWDSTIVRYNLRHDNPGEVDIGNYLAMSDKVLPLLYSNLDLVEKQMAQHRNNRVRWVEHLDPAEFRAALDLKRQRFEKRVAAQRWQESNLADRRTLAALSDLH